MFNYRMKLLLLGFVVFGMGLVFRLGMVQIGQHEQYAQIASSTPATPIKPIPPTRGRILARGPGGDGTVELVANEPCFELAVYYPVMDPDKWWISDQLRTMRRKIRKQRNEPKLKIPDEELLPILTGQIEQFWQNLGILTECPLAQLQATRERTTQVIRSWVENVHKDRETIAYPILEQRMYYPVVSDLDEDQAIDLRAQLGNSSWVIVRPSSRRLYRRGDTLCHLLGRTTRTPGSLPKTTKIIEKDYLPGELEGLSGLEAVCEEHLKGYRGWVETDEDPQIISQPEDGEDIVLTIDIALQEYIQHRLKKQVRQLPYATGAAAVVVDLQKWELLALASVPTFDPSEYVKKFHQLSNDNVKLPLFNRALWGRYAPGSIVKPILGAWAVSEGTVTPFQTFYCRGYLSENLRRFKCWLPSGHHDVDLIHAIKGSCDIYFYRLGELLTAEGVSEFYKKIGFGNPVPIGIDNAAGRVPTQEWFISHHGRGMSAGDARNLAIGQGDLEITPLQAAVMMSAVATGRYQPPRFIVGKPLPRGRPIGISAYALNLVRNGMDKTLNDSDGTGHKYAFAEELTVRAAGKTGSAQAPARSIQWQVSYQDPLTSQPVTHIVDNLTRFIRSSPVPRKDLNWRTIRSIPEMKEEDKRDPATGRSQGLAHAWFAGYAPIQRPRIAVVVLIEYGLAGGKAAGPVFHDIMLKCQDLGYIGDRRKITFNNWQIERLHEIDEYTDE
jgi:cell division protein FtsI/penicillin-binding protein 2